MDSNVGPNAFRTSLLHFGWRWPICGCSVFPSLPPSTKPFVCFSFPLSPLFLVCCEILLFFGGRGNEKYCAVHFPFFNRTCFFPHGCKTNLRFSEGGEVLAAFVAYNYFAELAGLGHGVECAGPKKAEHLSVNCSKTGPVPLRKSVTRAMCSWQASFKFVAAAFRLVFCERVSLLWSCVVLRFAWVVLAERAGGPRT